MTPLLSPLVISERTAARRSFCFRAPQFRDVRYWHKADIETVAAGEAELIEFASRVGNEAQLVARKFRVGLAVVLSVIKRVGNLRSRSLRRTQATDVQASSRCEEEVRRVNPSLMTQSGHQAAQSKKAPAFRPRPFRSDVC